MRGALRIWLVVFGVTCALIGLSHLFFGTASIIGGGPVNATIDADMRFYAVLFTAYGLAYIWCAQDLEARSVPINLLGLIFFVGGLSRLLSAAVLGWPHWFYVLMIPVELVVPVVNYFWLKAIRA